MKNLAISVLVTWLINIYGVFESRLQMAIWDVVFAVVLMLFLFCIDLMFSKEKKCDVRK